MKKYNSSSGFNANHNRQVIKLINDSDLIEISNGILLYKHITVGYFTLNASTTFITHHDSREKAKPFLTVERETSPNESRQSRFGDMALEIDFRKPKSE